MAQFSDKVALQDQLNSMVAFAAELATSGVSPQIMSSWSTKADAARAYLAGGATDLQKAMLDAEAQITGESTTDLAAYIAIRAGQFTVLAASIEGMRRKFTGVIAAAKDDELDAVFQTMVDAFEALKAGL